MQLVEQGIIDIFKKKIQNFRNASQSRSNAYPHRTGAFNGLNSRELQSVKRTGKPDTSLRTLHEPKVALD